jgi:hypothetical protein
VVKLPPTGIALEEIERQALVEALRMSNWVQKDAAERDEPPRPSPRPSASLPRRPSGTGRSAGNIRGASSHADGERLSSE